MLELAKGKRGCFGWIFNVSFILTYSVTEYLHCMVCSVLEINICLLDLQEIIIYKTIKKTFTAIYKGHFNWDSNPFQKKPPEVFYKKDVLKSFAIFSGKHLCWSLFLIKLKVFRSATFLKRDSSTGDFLWILWNLSEMCYYQFSCFHAQTCTRDMPRTTHIRCWISNQSK